MIITKEVEINVNSKHKKRYAELGYDITQKTILVNIKDVAKCSNVKIEAKCDICDKNKITPFKNYNNVIKNGGFYSCSSICSRIKVVKTNMERYGVDTPSKNIKIIDKIKTTNIERYGVECSLNNNIVKEKAKNTLFNNYGVDNPFQNENIKEKIRKQNIEKYGVEYTSQNKSIKEKIKKYNIEKYGVEYTLQSNVVKNKSKITNIKKYGVEYVSQNEDIKAKAKATRIKKNFQVSDDKLTEYELYKKIVENITNKNKKTLYSEWDGYDYYDGEYIRNYLNLKSNDKKYPTIDHKISTFYGFLNGIEAAIISDISNLCITKMVINSSKGEKTEEQYYKIKKP